MIVSLLNLKLKIIKNTSVFFLIIRQLTIVLLMLKRVFSSYGALLKFEEEKRSVRVARGDTR